MKDKDYLIFIRHILDSIRDIEESTDNISKKEFMEDKDVKDATIRRIEVIGEAVKNLSSSFRNKYPHIPWKEIVGTRDKMIHHYFGVDLNIVWNIVKIEVPKLKKKIRESIKLD